jgi:uncharacterized protein (DUF1015 family)
MAEILPLQALHYDLATVGRLQDVVAPPYDVIDAQRRAELAARSPYNVVHIDLPQAETGGGPYAHAAALLADWRAQGALVRDAEPAIWALTQDYRAPDGRDLTRRGFLCRVRVEDYGAGRIRPHERTHPGPKEDRLRLTRATKANLSPIFSLFSDPSGATWDALGPHVERDKPFDAVTDEDGTVNRLWRVADPVALAAVTTAVAGSELLIADGHHRYETARAYAEEIGGEGDHRYVLMCLVALEDPGLTVFPTHRLVTGLKDDSARQEALAAAIRRDFALVELDDERAVVPEPARDGRVRIGFIDAHFKRPFMLTLKDPSVADAALPDRAAPYRRLDTAVLEAILLKGPLGMTDATIDHLDGLGYARDFDEALARIHDESADVGFFMGATPVAHVQEVAAAGESMPPKSTYFFPKVPTGLVLSPLAG